MYLRRCYRTWQGKRHAYWALVESYRTARGPRQRVVSYLGPIDEAGRLGVAMAAQEQRTFQPDMFGESESPRYVHVDLDGVHVDRTREFGGTWLCKQVLDDLRLTEFLKDVMPSGREQIGWAAMAQVLVICRLLDASSELRIAETVYEKSALSDLLGIASEKVNDDRLYRSLDKLLPHKAALEKHLAQRLGELFQIDYDLLLYDVTSTYFEGEAAANDQAQRGYSRDHRPDCKQVCIALVVSRCGLPLGYEIFAGNTTDVTTVQTIVTTMEARYGQSDRVWVMDRGMISETNIAFLKEDKRRYIIGTPKSALRQFAKQLTEDGWTKIRDGLEVKLCPSEQGDEVFILCRSAQRGEKEKAIRDRFALRIKEALTRLAAICQKRKRDPILVSRQVGRLLGQNSRAAALFKVDVRTRQDGSAELIWEQDATRQDWSELSEGCYLLRSNVKDWKAEEIWTAYVQLTEAETAFRIHKSDLSVRPIWHQKKERVQAHILICFLAYVVWKTLGQKCRQAGLGDSPRKVIDELKGIQLVDVVLPTREGPIIRKRCIGRPTEHQAIVLQRLKMQVPVALKTTSF